MTTPTAAEPRNKENSHHVGRRLRRLNSRTLTGHDGDARTYAGRL